MDRIRTGDFVWADMREAFFDGFHRTLPVLAAAGNNLIVEHIVETPAWLERLVKLLDGVDVFVVGLHCPLAELERRERERGDRRIGEAKGDFESIHGFVRYDVEVSSMQSNDQNVRTVIDAWKSRTPPSVFASMREEVGLR